MVWDLLIGTQPINVYLALPFHPNTGCTLTLSSSPPPPISCPYLKTLNYPENSELTDGARSSSHALVLQVKPTIRTLVSNHSVQGVNFNIS